MLVLTRSVSQGVKIRTSAGVFRVVLLGVERGRAKLGFDCPAEMVVVREELENK